MTRKSRKRKGGDGQKISGICLNGGDSTVTVVQPQRPPNDENEEVRQNEDTTGVPFRQDNGLFLKRSLASICDRPVYSLREFLDIHAPALDWNTIEKGEDAPQNMDVEGDPRQQPQWPWELEQAILIPLTSCPVAAGRVLRKHQCREPVPSLVDDVVWALVQRRERGQRTRRHLQSSSSSSSSNNNKKSSDAAVHQDDYRNVLIQGYSTPREGEMAPRGMRWGVALRSHTPHPILRHGDSHCHLSSSSSMSVSSFPINEHLAFCKSSSTIQFLHSLVGDEVLRMILMHTRVLLPLPTLPHRRSNNDDQDDEGATISSSTNGVVEEDEAHAGQNYLLLCGPPLPSAPSSSSNRNGGTSTKTAPSRLGTKRGRTTQQEKSCTRCGNEEIATSDRLRRKKKRRRQILSHGPAQHGNGSISRFPLLYFDAHVPKIGLPKSHMLQKMKAIHLKQTRFQEKKRNRRAKHHSAAVDASKTIGYKLLGVILGFGRENKNKQRRLRKRLGQEGIELCNRVQSGHGRCDYHRLLERYCPLPPPLDAGSKKHDPLNEDCLPQLAHAYSCKDGITSFLAAVLKKVFPDDFWGSSLNFESFMESVKIFIHLRRRERLTNKCLMHGIRVTKVTWLMTPALSTSHGSKRNSQRSNHEAATKLTLTTFRWVFQGFIIPLLRSIFYVTETEFTAHQLHYYRKPVWSLFRSLSIQKLKGGKHFVQVPYTDARSRLRKQQMGMSRLRLLPKATGMRPIAQLSRKQNLGFLVATATNKRRLPTSLNCHRHAAKKPRIGSMPMEANFSPRLPTNIILKGALDILRYECSQREKPFGVGMDSLELFYPRYRDYILRLKQTTGPNVTLYAASVDIEKCYDRMNQEYLLDLLYSFFSKSSYFVQRLKVDCFSSPMTNEECSTESITRKSRYKKLVAPLEEYQAFHEGQHAAIRESKNTVFDLCKCTMTEKNEILELLKEHLHSHMVVVSGRFQRQVLQQCRGISQGSLLSTTLCNLYYGRVEEFLFRKEVEQRKDQENDLLARFVDDFLFVSPSKESVARFLSRTYEGEPRLGAEINRAKSLTSTTMSFPVRDTSEVDEVKLLSAPTSHRRNRHGRVLFPWCGLLLDLQTGEVSMDYERFCGGRLRDSLTADSNGKEGERLGDRMKSFVFPRCLPILFDATINCSTTIVVNYFHMMLLSAAKTAEYLRSQSTLTRGRFQNAAFVLQCIQELQSFAWHKIDRNLRTNLSPAKRKTGGFCLLPQQTSWLCWRAFHDVFSFLNDFDGLVAQLARSEPTYIETPNVPLARLASSALDDFQLRHFIV